MEAYRLLGLVINLGLNDEKIDIAARVGLPTSMGAEEDHLGIRGGRSQAATRLGDQILIHCGHAEIVVAAADHHPHSASRHITCRG